MTEPTPESMPELTPESTSEPISKTIPEGCDTCPNRALKKSEDGRAASVIFAAFLCSMAVGFSFDRKEGEFRPDPPPQVWVLMMLSATCLGITVPSESLAGLMGILSPKP